MNTLYYGDNLDILRRYIKDESVDLVYLDPPFNSAQDYNVLFREHDKTGAAAQIKAFEDTWCWNETASRAFQETVETGPDRVVKAMLACRTFLGDTDMLAYLSMIAPRLVELRRVLKHTGSIYLHCDPTASHYLKLVMDAVFGPTHFRNEIIWKRTSAHSAAVRWGDIHDSLLFYTKAAQYTWNQVLIPHSEEYSARYKHEDEDGRAWTDDNLTAPGIRHGDSGSCWRGFDVTSKGLHWKVNLRTVQGIVGVEQARSLSTTEKMDVLDGHGYIHWPEKRSRRGEGFPRFRRYLSEGGKVQDIITDIPPINSQAQERLGYPTQKPEALLERIIKVSSNSGDVILDPFCGCGTAVAVAENLKREWIGIDVTHLAITLIRHRLKDAFSDRVHFRIVGEPVSLPDAKTLAENDPYQFQWWALGLVGARPVEPKKGADKGIDGRLYFHDEPKKTKQMIFSVKAGHTTVAHVRDLRGVLEREKAEIGVLISLQAPTQPMKAEATGAGFYQAPYARDHKKHARIQLLTIADLLGGKGVDYPRENVTFKKAPKKRGEVAKNAELEF